VRRRLRAAWALDDHDRALDQLQALADELAGSHPGAAASLREGMQETLTVTRLGVRGRLKRTLASTNPCESMIETRPSDLDVTSSAGRTATCACAGPPLACSKPRPQFRRIIGHGDLAKLAVAIERDVSAKRAADMPATTAHMRIATAAPEAAASPA
jgi:putative transposase